MWGALIGVVYQGHHVVDALLGHWHFQTWTLVEQNHLSSHYDRIQNINKELPHLMGTEVLRQ